MITIRSSTEMAKVLSGALDPPLRQLLTTRRDELAEYDGYDLGELAHFIVVQRDDTPAIIEAEIGLPIASWAFESVKHKGRWLEAVLIVSDDGFGVVLFVPDRIDINPALLVLLLAQA